MDECTYEYWEKKGEKMQLSGEALFDWAEARRQKCCAREEKKEAERLAREEKKEAERLAREDRKEAERIEREERAREREAQREERDRKLEMERLVLEKERLAFEEKKLAHSERKLEEGVRETPEIHYSGGIKMPKLAPFAEGDDITAYLIRFENLATICEWPSETWASRLGLLFSGTSLNVYSSLPYETISNYADLKKAMLKAFKKTTDQYRREFRQSRIPHNLNFSQFLTNLYRLFDYWISSAEISLTYESLRDFMVRDQFLTAIPNEIRIFLKEQQINDPYEIAEAADCYAGAHNCYPQEKKTSFNSGNRNIHTRGKYTKPLISTEGQPSKDSLPPIKCFRCGEAGHRKSQCPSGKSSQQVGRCFVEENYNAPFCSGTINGANVSTILRDTGCTCVVVSSAVLPNLKVDGLSKCTLTDYLGRNNEFPVTKCYIKCKWFEGWTDVVVAPIKSCSILLGNIAGARYPTEYDKIDSEDTQSAETPVRLETIVKSSESKLADNHSTLVNVTTRSRKGQPLHPLIVPAVEPLKVTSSDFIELQNTCLSLENIREACDHNKTFVSKNSSYQYVRDTFLYKEILSSKNKNEVGMKLLVIPQDLRKIVLKLSHDIPVAGHFSHRKTLRKIKEMYYWPGMSVDIYQYCRSCDVCQRSSHKGRLKKVQMMKMPVFSVPFERIAVDLVGPITPCSAEGHKYILTMIDYATSFPEAVPLKNVTSIDVAEALMNIFSRVGIPREILWDRGPQFTSDVMEKVCELVGVKPLFTSPYHPMCNGRIERQHSILKSILKKLCVMKPSDWHRYLPCALFAMREIPSDSLGFSPFELLYGKQARGPLTIMNELWTNTNLDPYLQNSYQFVIDLRNRLQETSDLAVKNLKCSMESYKTYFDTKSTQRIFKEGDEVLLLLPDTANKLLVSWSGPYKVVKTVGKVDYVIDVKGKHKLYHVNLLKKYYRRQNALNTIDEDELGHLVKHLNLAQQVKFTVLEECEEDTSDIVTVGADNIQSLEFDISPELSSAQNRDLMNLLHEFSSIFSELPGCTSTVVHEIKLQTTDPVRRKLYPVPVHLRDEVNKEVDRLFNLGIIEESSSDYCAPIVMVKKKDNSFRLALDFRGLNAVTVFDAEPMPNIEDEIHKFNDAKFISEIDITKAYHQIMLHDNSKRLTAFPTYRGLMQYVRMPFGLVTACATYIRLMKKVLSNIEEVSVYFDNIFIISKNFESHLVTLRIVLERLQQHGLTARSCKCHFAYPNIQYLGVDISRNCITPLQEKVEALMKIPVPGTKKLLRSFMGIVSFYRKFIPNLSSFTAKINEKLKKDVKEPLLWLDDEKKQFELIKQCFTSSPVLRVPDISKIFVVRTDASMHGLGAVILQYHDNVPFPISFASRKLLPRESRYSTIEKECLAIIWAIDKFHYYLYGREFILETDHQPLAYLETLKSTNGRLQRWTLSLQPYKFRVVYIKGQDNYFADLLSRSTCN